MLQAHQTSVGVPIVGSEHTGAAYLSVGGSTGVMFTLT